MSKLIKAKIPYLEYNWNITKGCSKLSSGCSNCWALGMSKRLAGKGIQGYNKEDPFKPTFCHWKINEPSQLKKPSVIGVSFMGDLWHKDIDFSDIQEIFNQFWNNPQHTFVLCTKRPERILDLFQSYEDYDDPGLFDNVWFGCSIEDNKSFNQRSESMYNLKSNYALNTWFSIEPLLEDISATLGPCLAFVDGVIVGGESGTGARYCNPQWIANIYQLCKQNDTKFYFKQYGTNKENLLGLRSYEIIVPGINREFIPLKQVENTKNLPWTKK